MDVATIADRLEETEAEGEREGGAGWESGVMNATNGCCRRGSTCSMAS